jgi:hypothetical protein
MKESVDKLGSQSSSLVLLIMEVEFLLKRLGKGSVWYGVGG